MDTQKFEHRIIPFSCSKMDEMLESKGLKSYSELTPSGVRLKKSLDLAQGALSYSQYVSHIKSLALTNKDARCFIGMGYTKTSLPEVLVRGVYENPFAFKVEAIYNYYTMLNSLTAMKYSYSRASLGDACSDAMSLMYDARDKQDSSVLVVDTGVYPYVLDALMTYCEALGIDIVQDEVAEYEFSGNEFGCFVQYPSVSGEVNELSEFTSRAHSVGCKVACVVDLLSLCLLKTPKSWGADYVVGNSQCMGLPMAMGGACAAFLASNTKCDLSEADYNPFDTLAGFFALYYGSQGLKDIATDVNIKTATLIKALKSLGAEIKSDKVFSTIEVNIDAAVVSQVASQSGYLFYYPDEWRVRLTLDACTTDEDLETIAYIFAISLGKRPLKTIKQSPEMALPSDVLREDKILNHDVFNRYFTEVGVLSYIRDLESADINIACVQTSLPETLSEFCSCHPFSADDYNEGFLEALDALSADFATITALDSTSLQATSYSGGEFSSLMVAKAYYQSKGQHYRNVVLVPEDYDASQIEKTGMIMASYTAENFASVIKDNENELIVVMACLEHYDILREITELAHDAGSQVCVYTKEMDSHVGLTNAGYLGADMCLFNFHKSKGVVCVGSHLTDYLPTHCIVECGGVNGITAISESAYGNALTHLSSYSYIRLMGESGLKRAALCKKLINY